MIYQDLQRLACNQTCDSKGPHNQAVIKPGSAMSCNWTPIARKAGDWDNLYCWWELGAQSPSKVTVDWACVPQSLDGVNCLEFEFDQRLANHIYNGGWQFCFGTQKWRAFNYGLSRWMDTGITGSRNDFVPTQPVHLTAQYALDDKGVHFLCLSVNGAIYETSVVSPPSLKIGPDHFNAAYQFDSLNKGQPIAALVSGYTVTTF